MRARVSSLDASFIGRRGCALRGEVTMTLSQSASSMTVSSRGRTILLSSMTMSLLGFIGVAMQEPAACYNGQRVWVSKIATIDDLELCAADGPELSKFCCIACARRRDRNHFEHSRGNNRCLCRRAQGRASNNGLGVRGANK